MFRSILPRLALLVLATVVPVSPQPLPISGELTVNATTAGEQVSPAIAADGADNFRLVWQTAVGEPVHHDVRTRRLQANGSLGTDALLSESTTRNQRSPEIDVSEGGDWVAIWTTDHAVEDVYEIFGRLTTGGGTFLGAEFEYATGAPIDGAAPSVAAVGEDDLVGSWRNTGDDDDIAANFRTRAGVQFGTSAVAAVAPGALPRVTSLFGDRWVIVWHDVDADGTGAYFRCYQLDDALEPGVVAHPVATGAQTFPDVASDGAFRFAVVWQHEQEIRARRFAYDGVGDCFPVGGEIPVSTPGETSLYPRVDMAADGTFVVTWASNAIDADGGVVAREFLANGTPVGQAFAVNTTTLGLQTVPDTAISAGTFAVTWNTPDSGAAPPRNVVVRRYARRVVFSDGFESNDFTAWSDTEF